MQWSNITEQITKNISNIISIIERIVTVYELRWIGCGTHFRIYIYIFGFLLHIQVIYLKTCKIQKIQTKQRVHGILKLCVDLGKQFIWVWRRRFLNHYWILLFLLTSDRILKPKQTLRILKYLLLKDESQVNILDKCNTEINIIVWKLE